MNAWEWIPETPASWDTRKAGVLGELDPALFGLGRPASGDALGDEWWRVEDDTGATVAYGRLDESWGDAEILVLVHPDMRRTGAGSYVLSRLEDEAGKRRLNYIYNVVPHGHPDPEQVTDWLAVHGFVRNDVGELRKQIRAGAVQNSG
ncbi:GNAT family N-acetyltransferase [Pseudonocardia parietis]|uniref:N-acetylglutamate synthase-like GNAT family acetyltransferase n=1 Tax=Pseudonocardia parietis TaxID=570936 RepID=A0ABS4W334_9PSEU|nr:GNAT family N-acetyltransferase [Pseudonocardia parietis]MBP2370581.1 N-acetylglutamate synthase-like GNAT family acetyltransferase [Pseudonocardia parietis]